MSLLEDFQTLKANVIMNVCKRSMKMQYNSTLKDRTLNIDVIYYLYFKNCSSGWLSHLSKATSQLF